MTVSKLEPSPSENVNREIYPFNTIPAFSIDPPVSDTYNNDKQFIKISSLDGFKRRLFETGISERACDLIPSTMRQCSLSNYNSCRPK